MNSANRKTSQTLQTVFLLLIAIVVVACLLVVQVSANDGTSDKRKESISYGCSTIKLRLKQLQSDDASVRVVLGQNYENMLTKLMDAMNNRLASNRVSSGELPGITVEFSKNLEYFRKNYISYDQKIDDLRKMNCEKDPSQFYEQLEKARKLRGELRFNYDKLNELIGDYSSELNSVWSGRGESK
ncbi:MAG: hypothetical protein LBG75_00670 [Candidatus Nomurabacteria bacterium]|jgi:hypothetical protein|nr:hypothetical protein [Candidatus Nomurabacteria bacterium]